MRLGWQIFKYKFIFRYQWEQDQIAHMKNYIARFGHGSAKLARQAQSKEKTLAKMVAGGLTEKVRKLTTVSKITRTSHLLLRNLITH